MKNTLPILGAFIPVLFLASIVIGALGAHTDHYQCKYITSVTVKVADTGKYTDALYAINYSDGTTGLENFIPNKLRGGVLCKTVMQWGWPYHATNREVEDQSQVKE